MEGCDCWAYVLLLLLLTWVPTSRKLGRRSKVNGAGGEGVAIVEVLARVNGLWAMGYMFICCSIRYGWHKL